MNYKIWMMSLNKIITHTICKPIHESYSIKEPMHIFLSRNIKMKSLLVVEWKWLKMRWSSHTPAQLRPWGGLVAVCRCWSRTRHRAATCTSCPVPQGSVRGWRPLSSGPGLRGPVAASLWRWGGCYVTHVRRTPAWRPHVARSAAHVLREVSHRTASDLKRNE